jgi:hypothetical protein
MRITQLLMAMFRSRGREVIFIRLVRQHTSRLLSTMASQAASIRPIMADRIRPSNPDKKQKAPDNSE